MESIQPPSYPFGDIMGDPHRIRDDIEELHDSVDRKQVVVFMKLNDRGSVTKLKLEDLLERVGRPVTSREFFLNGQPEPAKYDDDQTLSENVLALRNEIRHNKVSIDTMAQKLSRDIKKMQEAMSKCSSSNPNALPKADFEKIKKEIAEQLVKVSTMSKGTAFSTMDLESRLVVAEKETTKMARKIDAVAKAIAVLKNGRGQSSSTETNLPIGINRFDERLLKLEEQAFGDQSRNLFASTMETTIDVLTRDVNDLRKDVKLNLASSETNQWLDAKLKAFLDTPVFLERVKSEIKNYMINYHITTRNMPQDTRKQIIEVIKIISIKNNLTFNLGCGTRNTS